MVVKDLPKIKAMFSDKYTILNIRAAYNNELSKVPLDLESPFVQYALTGDVYEAATYVRNRREALIFDVAKEVAEKGYDVKELFGVGEYKPTQLISFLPQSLNL